MNLEVVCGLLEAIKGNINLELLIVLRDDINSVSENI